MSPRAALTPASPPASFSRLLVLLSALTFGVGGIAARPLRIAYTACFPCVPLGIAEERKLWRAAGLPVELRGYDTSQEAIAALKAGDVDLAYDFIATWLEAAVSGSSVVVVAETDWSNGGDKLLLRQGSKLADLKGKPIAVPKRGSALLIFLREALAREGLGVPDFPIIEVPERDKAQQLFAEGKIDVIISSEPWASRIEKAGARTIATTADFPGISPEGFAIRRDAVDDATLKTFFKVWYEAVAFLHQPANHAKVADIASIYAFAGAEAITAGDVAMYAKATPVHDPARALQHNDVEQGNARQLLQRFAVLMRLQGRRITDADLTKHFHLTPLRDVATQLAAAQP